MNNSGFLTALFHSAQFLQEKLLPPDVFSLHAPIRCPAVITGQVDICALVYQYLDNFQVTVPGCIV